MNIPSNIITLIAGVVLTLVSLWYGQNHGLLPTAASAEAVEIDGLFDLMMTISTGLFLLVEGVIIYSAIKFRRKKGDNTDGPPIEGNVPLEIVWTAIPTVIVFILAIYSFEVYNNLGGLDPMASHDHKMASQEMASSEYQHDHQQMMAEANLDNSQLIAGDNSYLALGLGDAPGQGDVKPLEVKVNGIQYAWIFTYPETGIISGELHVPVDRPVKLIMSAGDVIHAFWLPEFRIKQDVIPGREALLSFTATKTGQYPVVCAELCGAYHGGMKTTLTVHSQEDYQQWLQENTIAKSEVDGNVAFK